MQLAYAPGMSKEKYTGPRVQRRLHWLKVLVAEGGGPTSVGAAVGTPPSHISAMTAGRRGVGDALADSLESAFGRPNGWMDRPIPEAEAPLGNPTSEASKPTLAQALEVVATKLNLLTDDQREMVAQRLQTLARAPDSQRAREAVLATLEPSAQESDAQQQATIAPELQEQARKRHQEALLQANNSPYDGKKRHSA